jgi:hypothetical protein
MTPATLRNPWTLFGAWIALQAAIAAAAGCGAVLLSLPPFERYDTTLYQLVSLALIGATVCAIAAAQAAVIARAFPIRPVAWAGATAAALLTAALISAVLNTAITRLTTRLDTTTIDGLFFLKTLIVAAVGCLILGGVQTILLAPHTTAPLLWFAATALARLITGPGSALLTSALITIILANTRSVSPFPIIGGINAVINFLNALLTAVLTGLALVYLLHHPRPTPAARPTPDSAP